MHKERKLIVQRVLYLNYILLTGKGLVFRQTQLQKFTASSGLGCKEQYHGEFRHTLFEEVWLFYDFVAITNFSLFHNICFQIYRLTCIYCDLFLISYSPDYRLINKLCVAENYSNRKKRVISWPKKYT